MPLNAFMQISNAKGESRQAAAGPGSQSYEGWVEIQAWEWEVTAETSWKKGGGASVGKPDPGAMSFEHYYNSASPTILAYICSGKSFDVVKLHMCKTTGGVAGGPQGHSAPAAFFMMTLKDVFITKVNQSANEEGNVVQKIEIVFKEIGIEYKPQNKNGTLGAVINYNWNIPAGTSSGHGA